MACRLGNAKQLRAFLMKRQSTNVMDNRGWRALHHAAAGGHLECVRLLLDAHDLEINATTFDRQTALNLTIKATLDIYVIYEIVKVLLEAGADPNVENDTQHTNILNSAIATEYPPLVELLLMFNANVNAIDDNYGTCIHAAAEYKSVEILKLLLKRNITCHSTIVRNCTFLQASIVFCPGYVEFLKTLLRHPKSLVHINTQNIEGETPLSMACERNWREAVDLLLDYGGDPNIRTKRGFLPLHLAVLSFPDDVTENSVFTRLYSMTSRSLILEQHYSRPEKSLVHCMIKFNKINMLRFVEDQKWIRSADVFRCSIQEFLSSVHNRHTEEDLVRSTDVFSGYSAEMDVLTPLAYWCMVCHKTSYDFFHVLLEWGSEVNPSFEGAVPPIVMCCMAGTSFEHNDAVRLKVIEELLRRGADVHWKLKARYMIPDLFYMAAVQPNHRCLEFILANSVPAGVIFDFSSLIYMLMIFALCFTAEGNVIDLKRSNLMMSIGKFLPRLPFGESNPVMLNSPHSPKSLKNLSIIAVRDFLYDAQPHVPLTLSIQELRVAMDLPLHFEDFLKFYRDFL